MSKTVGLTWHAVSRIKAHVKVVGLLPTHVSRVKALPQTSTTKSKSHHRSPNGTKHTAFRKIVDLTWRTVSRVKVQVKATRLLPPLWPNLSRTFGHEKAQGERHRVTPDAIAKSELTEVVGQLPTQWPNLSARSVTMAKVEPHLRSQNGTNQKSSGHSRHNGQI